MSSKQKQKNRNNKHEPDSNKKSTVCNIVNLDNYPTMKIPLDSVKELCKHLNKGNTSRNHEYARRSAHDIKLFRSSLMKIFNCKNKYEVILMDKPTAISTVMYSVVNSFAKTLDCHPNLLIDGSLACAAKTGAIMQENGLCDINMIPVISRQLDMKSAHIDLQTCLVICEVANEYSGIVHNTTEIIRECHKNEVPVFFDMSTFFPYYHIDAAKMDLDAFYVDFAAIGGFANTGALIIKSEFIIGNKLNGLIADKSMQSNLYSNNINVPLYMGSAYSIKMYSGVSRNVRSAHCKRLKQHFVRKLTEKYPCLSLHEYTTLSKCRIVIINNPIKGFLCNIFTICLIGADSEMIRVDLEQKNIIVDRGAPKYVIDALELPTELHNGIMRISFAYETTMEDLDAFVDALRI